MNNTDISSIPLKDLFYLVGIVVTLFLGIKNISILNINRKNSLRESVYKEQMNFMIKLSSELINLHRSMAYLSNNKLIVTNEQSIEITERIVVIHEVLISNAVICSDTILELSKIMLEKADNFLADKIEHKKSNPAKFNDYYLSFISIISEFKSELGIRELKRENQSLFERRKELFKM